MQVDSCCNPAQPGPPKSWLSCFSVGALDQHGNPHMPLNRLLMPESGSGLRWVLQPSLGMVYLALEFAGGCCSPALPGLPPTPVHARGCYSLAHPDQPPVLVLMCIGMCCNPTHLVLYPILTLAPASGCYRLAQAGPAWPTPDSDPYVY